MNDKVSRRGALRHLLRETVRNAEAIGREVVPAFGDAMPTRKAPVGERPKREAPGDPGPPPSSLVPNDQLLAWADEAGLGEHAEAIQEAARLSYRVTTAGPGGGTGASKLWGTADLAPGNERTARSGVPLGFLAQFDLGKAAESGRLARGAPDRGLMAAFHSPRGELQMARGDIDQCQVLWQEQLSRSGASLCDAESSPTDGTPFLLSPELMLPRVWSPGPRALGLNDEQRDSWEELRLKLARAQGVEPFDRKPRLLAIHRLFGYPDERTGDMPLICELLDAGLDLGARPARAHPEAKRLEPASHRWRLLLQLSRSRETRSALRTRRDRLYLWIPEGDLKAGEYSNVRAIQR